MKRAKHLQNASSESQLILDFDHMADSFVLGHLSRSPRRLYDALLGMASDADKKQIPQDGYYTVQVGYSDLSLRSGLSTRTLTRAFGDLQREHLVERQNPARYDAASTYRVFIRKP